MDKYAIKSNVFREKWSEQLDEVVRVRPKLITRRRDRIFAMNNEHLAALVENAATHIRLEQEEDGSYIAVIEEIEDVFATGETVKEAVEAVAKELLEYANDYYEHFDEFFHSPNRKNHYALIMKILMMEQPRAVSEYLYAELQRA